MPNSVSGSHNVLATFSVQAMKTAVASWLRAGREKTRKSKAESSESNLVKRPKRGYDLFRSHSFHADVPGNTTFEKTSSLVAKWRALSEVERLAWQAKADAHTVKASDLKGENLVEFFDRHRGTVNDSCKHARLRTEYMTDRARAVRVSANEMIDHKVFTSGSQIYDFDAGVKPGCMQLEVSYEQAKATASEIFGYDHQAVPNPWRTSMNCFQPCCLLNGGMCEKDTLVDVANILTYNTCVECRRWEKELPILLELRSEAGVPAGEATVRWCFLGRLIGLGKLAFCTRRDYHDPAGAGSVRQRDIGLGPA